MNPKKSKCILFSNKNKPSAINGVFMNGDPISIVTEVKHLGITLDRKLTWQSHIDRIIEKSNKALAPINILKFKLPTWCLLRYYKAFVRPILEYASPVWSGCSINSINRLEKCQYRAMLAISGCIKTTSTEKLTALLGLPPLEFRRNCDKLTIIYKIRSGITPSYLIDVLNEYNPPFRANRRDPYTFRLPRPRKTITIKNFFYSALDMWNKLPLHIRNQMITPKQFKLNLVKQGNHSNTLKLTYYFGNRRLEYIFNRIVLDLSSLNAHLFRHNLIDDPACSCGSPNENTYHYLLDCDIFDLERNDLLAVLDNLPNITLPTERNSRQRMQEIFELFFLPPSPSSYVAAHAIQQYIEVTERFDS